MRFYNIVYFFREAFDNLKRSPLISLATVSTIGITLFILGIFWIAVINLNALASNFESQLYITVYLKTDITEEHLQGLKMKIKSWPQVKTPIKYISKEVALDLLKARLKNNDSILSFITMNPLPASFEIRARTPKDIKKIAEHLRGLDGVDSISYAQELVEKVLSLIKLIKFSGIFIILLLSFSSLMIINNTIRLTVYARKDEIEIMQLVGATNWFIRWPFLIEGLLQGVIGGLLAVFVLYFIYNAAVTRIDQVVPWLGLITQRNIISGISIKIVLIGIILGIIGSLFAVKRFLRS